ncbi:MAG TPA: hypothetical protein DIC36_00755 [Gammaproteobacteria bacterium]|nr:hypothetical protein [Gammaproteobacteria bacterium]
MPYFSRLVVVTLGAILVTTAGADSNKIYKSTDAEGNVTYSSTPPIEPTALPVEVITPAPPPGPEAVRAAEAEQKRTEEFSGQLEKERKTREAERAAQEAKNQTLVIERPVYIPVVPVGPISRPLPPVGPPGRPRPPRRP